MADKETVIPQVKIPRKKRKRYLEKMVRLMRPFTNIAASWRDSHHGNNKSCLSQNSYAQATGLTARDHCCSLEEH